MGNVNGNALPRGQVEYFQQAARKLCPSGHSPAIWIDTSCVLVMKFARSRAIGTLVETYKNVDKALVLDRELQSYRSSSRTEMATRIVMGKWMQRLWTFQAAALVDDPYAVGIRAVCKSTTVQESICGRILGTGFRRPRPSLCMIVVKKMTHCTPNFLSRMWPGERERYEDLR